MVAAYSEFSLYSHLIGDIINKNWQTKSLQLISIAKVVVFYDLANI